MKRFLTFSSCLLSVTSIALANGGGYYRGGVETAGDVTGFEPSNTENIRILDEKLTVLLGPKHAEVEVRYLMRNESPKKTTVRFGFPVEESVDGSDFDEKQMQPNPEKLLYCRDYKATAAGKPLKVQWQGEVKTLNAPLKGVAGWLISELSFAAGEEKPVKIRFTSDYPASGRYVSDDEWRSAALFKYRLSTAACWAGTIGSGEITLKPAGIPSEVLKVIKPVNRFKKEDGAWVWRFENLEPTLADDLAVETAPSVRSFSRHINPEDYESPYVDYIQRGEKWSMAHSNYKVKASSILPPDGQNKYDAENIRDRSDDKFWSEGAPGPGTGEWLELTPEVPKPLTAISLLPGCWKSAELFAANARPKKVLVELNGEHRQTIEIPDAMKVFEMPVLNYDKPVKTVRLTFEEVWPGKRFEDLCVTNVMLHARLDKEPKIQPAR